MTKTNVQPIPSNSQHHDTPNNKTHVIKFRVTAEEKASLELTCKLLNLSLSTFIRRAIHNVKIEKTVIVAGGGEETLNAVSTLLAQCSRVGGNLNQLARHFNSGGADTEQIRAKLLDELADLTAFRLHAEKVLGELYGNAQAYRLSRKSSCIVQPCAFFLQSSLSETNKSLINVLYDFSIESYVIRSRYLFFIALYIASSKPSFAIYVIVAAYFSTSV